jgi:Protein of unknown function (DUF1569)
MKTLARYDDQAEILLRLRALRPESVRRWGRMSVHEMVCHLSDSFRMVLGQKPVCPAPGRLQPTMIKWIALYLPLPWPAGILKTTPELDQELGGTRPIDFAADVAELEALLSLVTTHRRDFDGQSHPIFGRMSEAAWLRWAYLHMDHHLRQFSA